MNIGFRTTWVVAVLATLARSAGADVVIDCAKELGPVRPLHGTNGGPVEQQGMIDLTAYHKAARVPLTRLHDCNWPNADVVDVHTIFPNFAADPDAEASYDFVRTDEYVRSVLATGSAIVFRLGESIQHGKDKRLCGPPADTDKWAKVCVNIVRHYNDGWAKGFKYGIKYWEIWNEPENRPACWTGTDEDYYRLYVTTSKAIKARFPGAMVGGPAGGSPGKIEKNGTFKGDPFILGFLERCKRDGAPLDFFSWHRYARDPAEFAPRARGVRAMLDAAGFAKAESHLNEWNYLPDADWTPVMPKGQGAARQRFLDRLGGAEGAAFIVNTLITLQDLPVDQANQYSASTQGFGMFTPAGEPRRSYFGLKAFATLAEMPVRVGVSGAADRVAIGAAKGPREVRVLIANFNGPEEARIEVRNWPWEGAVNVEEVRVDEKGDWRVVRAGERLEKRDATFLVAVKAPGVCLLTFTRSGPK